MPIHPLPQFEADLAEAEREAYERLKPPTSLVVRFGVMKMVGEFPYAGESKPGCGSKIVVRTHRGVELGEMLTSTCPNAGCSKSVTRKQMLEYIENSGGADYPFSSDGRALRVATIEDMNEQRRLEGLAPGMMRTARAYAAELALPMKIVDAEPILGGERLTFYFTSEDRVDFRDLVQRLAKEYGSRIEMRQVGARDEARLTADYERCGQHCCCKQFLKVLKPVSMRSAKVQKATLDPLKISGRCGRLMCCLRYEDETYETLRKRLPRMKSRVGTPEGPGIVVDTQILTQLALVQLEREHKRIAVPVEELTDPGEALPPPAPPAPLNPRTPSSSGARPRDGREQRESRGGGGGAARPAPDPLRGMDPARIDQRQRGGGPPGARQDAFRDRSIRQDPGDSGRGRDEDAPNAQGRAEGEQPGQKKKRRRKRRRRGGEGGGSGADSAGGSGGGPGGSSGGAGGGGSPPNGG